MTQYENETAVGLSFRATVTAMKIPDRAKKKMLGAFTDYQSAATGGRDHKTDLGPPLAALPPRMMAWSWRMGQVSGTEIIVKIDDDIGRVGISLHLNDNVDDGTEVDHRPDNLLTLLNDDERKCICDIEQWYSDELFEFTKHRDTVKCGRCGDALILNKDVVFYLSAASEEDCKYSSEGYLCESCHGSRS